MKIFRKAHTELLSMVGGSDPVSGYVAAPSLAHALCQCGQRDAAAELVAEVERAEMRSRSWSARVFDLRRVMSANWDGYGKLVSANMRVAVGAPDAEVQGILSQAAAAGSGTPAGSWFYTRAGEGAWIREQLGFTEAGLREWRSFLLRRARGAGGRELNDAWAAYTCAMDENIRVALTNREKQQQRDEQQRRDSIALGYVLLFMGAVVLLFLVTCDDRLGR